MAWVERLSIASRVLPHLSRMHNESMTDMGHNGWHCCHLNPSLMLFMLKNLKFCAGYIVHKIRYQYQCGRMACVAGCPWTSECCPILTITISLMSLQHIGIIMVGIASTSTPIIAANALPPQAQVLLCRLKSPSGSRSKQGRISLIGGCQWPVDCYHIFSLCLMSLQQLWVTMVGLASTSIPIVDSSNAYNLSIGLAGGTINCCQVPTAEVEWHG